MAAVRAELVQTYRQLERLLRGDATVPATMKDRIFAARQLVSELADPESIDQGMASHACRMTGAQCRLASVRPSVVAKVVADALLDGKVRYGAPEKSVVIDAISRTPASRYCLQVPVNHNERS